MAELPSGAVTFLFTDIEGSTRLLKHLREQYGDVLAEHQRLLRAAFDAHGGHEVDTQGDSFFVAFASAREALLAAVEGQLALLSHPWPDGVQVKVRMGLHTGQAVVRDGRYTGLAVHRAARIGAAGHGGQVLVSQATQTLLEDEEEDLHVFLRDLGEQRLKDLERPVRLYQAGADGLPESFPPPRGEAPLAQAAEAALAPPWWRRREVLAAAALVVVAVAAATAFLGTRGSSGGLSAVQPNHVGIIDPETNEIVDEVAVGLMPGPVDVGGGSVWVGSLEDRDIRRIDPSSHGVKTIQLDRRTPTGIDFGEGALWVAHGVLGSLSRVDPRYEEADDPIKLTLPTHQGTVAVGGEAVWAAFGDSTLARVDQAAMRPRSTGTRDAPAGLVFAAKNVWVVCSGDNTVQLFDPDTFEQGELDFIPVGRQPSGIAFGHSAIWVANAGDDTVTRIDPTSRSVSSVIPVGDGPTAVATGAGAVWVANTDAGTVSRIDPAKNEVVETIEVGSPLGGVAFGEGFVWVARQSP